MTNDYFQFKQFTIHQDRCAMKVGTDGVLLGAWTDIGEAKRILDIGTGTGLIALMLAQRSDALIDAIEIDREAAMQAAENVETSPWKNRIRIINTSLNEFISGKQSYDLIVTNPPYFMNALPATDARRTIARHDHQLNLNGLLRSVKNVLAPDGRFDIILPPEVFHVLTKLATAEFLHSARKTLVHTAPGKPVKRILAEFSGIMKEELYSEIVIEKYGRHKYSEEYIGLTKDFYLKF
jgi:tRNA1Val (adenine37-N6)-methyltransferase